MPRLRERLAQQRNQFDSFPASTGHDSCRRAVKIVDIDQACVVSLVDRLVHHAEVIAIEGESYRLKEAKERSEQLGAKRRKAAS